MKKLLFLLTILPIMLSAASFDCDKAKTEVEKLICKDPELSKLDDEMGKAYKLLLAETGDKKPIIKEQTEWLKERNSCIMYNKSISAYDLELTYKDRIADIRRATQALKDRVSIIKQTEELQKKGYCPTYADVLENTHFSEEQSNSADYYDFRPANNFALIGGTKKQLCKDVLGLFNEQGSYKGKNKDKAADVAFWFLNNSGLVAWTGVQKGSKPRLEKFNQIYYNMSGMQYIEQDINNDNISAYVYRIGYRLSSVYYQEIHIFDIKLQDNPDLLKNQYTQECERRLGKGKCDDDILLLEQAMLSPYIDNGLEWKSTKEMESLMRRIVYNQKSMDILYPNNSLKFSKNNALAPYPNNGKYWNLYKIKSGTVAVLSPYLQYLDSAPEFLVFSLHRDKLATLECILAPKKW